MVWVWIWKISPKNVKFFNFLPFGSKKILSGSESTRVRGGLASCLLRVKSKLRPGPISRQHKEWGILSLPWSPSVNSLCTKCFVTLRTMRAHPEDSPFQKNGPFRLENTPSHHRRSLLCELGCEKWYSSIESWALSSNSSKAVVFHPSVQTPEQKLLQFWTSWEG